MFTAAQAAQKARSARRNQTSGFTAAQAAQKATILTTRANKEFTAAQAAQKKHSSTADLNRAFTAAQAAQKIPAVQVVPVNLFTAAQAAQKWTCAATWTCAAFTAAQAAQKFRRHSELPQVAFTAAQAAPKEVSNPCFTINIPTDYGSVQLAIYIMLASFQQLSLSNAAPYTLLFQVHSLHFIQSSSAKQKEGERLWLSHPDTKDGPSTRLRSRRLSSICR